MNIQQLEYIVALDKYRHFVKAAESCNVSQPTLSLLIRKLEEELDVVIFDRNTHPVSTTALGQKIINQAKVALFNIAQLRELATSEKSTCTGKVHIGIIPTVAPYVLPQMFRHINEKGTQLELKVSEMRTSVILDKLQKAEIDMAILATPLDKDGLLEIPLYYEKFVAYVSPKETLYSEEDIDSQKMPTEHLWVLQEGHCMRNQVFNFCQMRSSYSTVYEAGSIETLVKIVDTNGGYTVIPELHVPLLNEKQRENVRNFTHPAPVREISLIIRSDYVRERVVNEIINAVKTVIPYEMLDSRLKKFAVRL